MRFLLPLLLTSTTKSATLMAALRTRLLYLQGLLHARKGTARRTACSIGRAILAAAAVVARVHAPASSALARVI